jgi:hypothetical protein
MSGSFFNAITRYCTLVIHQSFCSLKVALLFPFLGLLLNEVVGWGAADTTMRALFSQGQ